MSGDTPDQQSVAPPSTRSIGFAVAACLLIVALWPLAAGGAIRQWAAVGSVLGAALAMVSPRVFAPFVGPWMRLGMLLGSAISPLALGIVFFFVVTPTGLIMRLLGKDPLRLRQEGGKQSYWIDRDPPTPAPDTFGRQF